MIAAGQESPVAAPRLMGGRAETWRTRVRVPNDWGMSALGAGSTNGTPAPGGERTNVTGNTRRTATRVNRGGPGTRVRDTHPMRALVPHPDRSPGRREHKRARDCRSSGDPGPRCGTNRMPCGGGDGLAVLRQDPPAGLPDRQLLAARASASVDTPRARRADRARASTRITEATR